MNGGLLSSSINSSLASVFRARYSVPLLASIWKSVILVFPWSSKNKRTWREAFDSNCFIKLRVSPLLVCAFRNVESIINNLWNYSIFRNVKGEILLGEEIIGVVNPISQGSASSASLYVLVPLDLRNRLKIDEKTRLVILLAENGDIIYRKQEA